MKGRPLPAGAKRHSEHAQKVFSGVRFDTYQWQQKQFDDSVATYEVVRRDDTVVVIPVIGDKIIIVNEQQPHWEKPGLTLIAGMVKKDEDIVDAARRELGEETGMVFKHFHLVYIEPMVPGVEWVAYAFVATNYLETKNKHLDAGEKNEVMQVSIDELIRLTRKKAFLYPPRFIEDFLIQDKLTELKKVLRNPKEYSKTFTSPH